jgi:hypothetical protein
VNRAIAVLVVGVLAGLLLQGCGNRNPVITGLTTVAEVEAGKSAVVTCTAEDPDDDTLSYEWSCSRGSFVLDSGPSARWNAPMASGADTISVAVSDGRGGEASKNVTLAVLPTTRTLAACDAVLLAGRYDCWFADIDAGTRIHGSFSVDSLDINFLVLDNRNWTKWLNSQSYVSLLELDHTPGDSFSDTIPSSGRYEFVLDNTYSPIDKQVHIYVEGTTP